MFIRFIAGKSGRRWRGHQGIIARYSELLDRGRFTPEEAIWLREIMGWLNQHLPVPPYATRRFPGNAVCWFWDTAHEPLARMWDIMAVLREHGQPCGLLRAADPGRILYTDNYQVLAQPERNFRAKLFA